jgi:hypothetical protein
MSKHNPVQPTTTITLHGAEYELLFDINAVALAEDTLDRPLLTGLRQRDFSSPTVSLVRGMLYACITARHPEVTFEQAKAFVTRKNLGEVWTTVLAAWVKGIAEPEPAKDVDGDPTQDQL